MAKRMTKQEKKDWDELYEYVRTNVLGYDQNQSLSRSMVLRLKGLLNNKFMANNNIDDTAKYSYRTVLNTFKFCILDIRNGLRNNKFKDENHKMNYILKIVESNLNNVYIRMKEAEQVKKEAESLDVSHAANYVNTFKSRDNSKQNSKYDDLW